MQGTGLKPSAPHAPMDGPSFFLLLRDLAVRQEAHRMVTQAFRYERDAAVMQP